MRIDLDEKYWMDDECFFKKAKCSMNVWLHFYERKEASLFSRKVSKFNTGFFGWIILCYTTKKFQ